MRKYAILLLLCSSLSFSQNCDYSLSGKVKDLHDGSVLSAAIISIKNNGVKVSTDTNGTYFLSNLCKGKTYRIEVVHPECNSRFFTVKISGDTRKDFKIEHHLEELNEVILTGKAYAIQSKTIAETKVSSDVLDRFSSSSIAAALNSISGVSSIGKGNGILKPLINGLHSSRVVIMNNGVRMQDQEWGAEHAPNIDINSIGRLSLVKNTAALEYGGDALGGIIIAEGLKVPLKDSIYGKTTTGFASNGRGGVLSTQLTKSTEKGWFTSLQASIKQFGDFESPGYILSNTGILERNASFRLGLNKINFGMEAYYSFYSNNIGILRSSHLLTAADQIRGQNSDIPLIINDFTYQINAPNQNISHHLARLKGFVNLTGLGKLQMQYDFQKNHRLEFDIRRGDDRDKASVDLELKTHTIKIDLKSVINDELGLKSGLMTAYQNNYANPLTGVRRLIPDYDKYNIGAYVIADYQPKEDWYLEAGLRHDFTYMDAFKFYKTAFWESRNYGTLYPEIVVEELTNQVLANPIIRFHNTSASFGIRHSFKKNQLYFNYALSSRAPNPSELFSEGLHHSGARIELGDLSFTSEIGNKFSLTLEQKSKNFSYSIHPYIHLISNFTLIEPIEIEQTIRGSFQVWEYRQTEAELIGLDVDASMQLNPNLSFKHQFSLIKGYDKVSNKPLISMPPVSTKNELVFHNPKWNNFKMSLQSEYVFKQNEYPNNNFEVYIPQTETMETVDVSSTPEAYHLINFNTNVDLKFSEKYNLNIGFGVANVLNNSYRDYLNLLRFYADDLGRNFLLNLKINY